MAEPDYLICLECDSPTYTFEWGEEGATEIVCETCGNDDLDLFLTEEQFDSLADEAESAKQPRPPRRGSRP